MRLSGTGFMFCVVLFGMFCILDSPIFGQSDSSSRRPSESQELEFPGVGDKRSLLSKMIDEGERETNPRPLSAKKSPPTTAQRTRDYVGNDPVGQRLSRDRNPILSRNSKQSQYPIYPTRRPQESYPHPVRSQRSLRVTNTVPKAELGIVNRTNKRRVNNLPTEKTKSSHSRLRNGDNENRKVVRHNESAPLVSVLESRNLVPFSPRNNAKMSAALERRQPRNQNNQHADIRHQTAKKVDVQNKRPSEILLDAERSGNLTQLREVSNRVVRQPDNIFDSRQMEKSAPSHFAERTARREAVIDNLSDTPDITFEESVPVGQGRIVFNRTTERNDENRLGLKDSNKRQDIVEGVESETFEPAEKTKTVTPLTRPSKLLLNKRSRYNLSTLRSTSSNNKLRIPNGNNNSGDGIKMSFGDQENERQESVIENRDIAPLEDLNRRRPGNASPSPTDTIKKKVAADADKVLTVAERKEKYLGQLHRSLPAAPAQLALSYVDDDGSDVPKNSLQTQYLVDFSGYYANEFSDNLPRVDSRGGIWAANCAVWASPNICYQPLYFENVNLERYGARYPFFQPALSGVHFFGSAIRLPYMTALDPINVCKYSAGFGRPGNKYCYQRERMPWSLKAGSFQALLVTAAVFALP